MDNNIILIEVNGADGFIDEIDGSEYTMTVGEMIEWLKNISDNNLDRKIYASIDNGMTYKSISTSNFETMIIKKGEK